MTGRRLALAWFASEHAVLLAVVHCAASSGSDEHTWRLARASGSHLGNRAATGRRGWMSRRPGSARPNGSATGRLRHACTTAWLASAPC